MSLWSISYLLPPLVSLTLSHTHVWPGHQEKKKKRVWILEKVKVLLQQEDYHYGYWGISYKECGPPLTYLSFLLVCREYILRSKQVKKRTLVGQREWDHLCEISWENQLWNLGCIICFFFFSNFNFIIRVINK